MPKITTSSDEDEPAQRTTTMLGDILAPLDGLTPYDTPHDRPSAKGSGEEDGGEEDDQEDDQESEEEGEEEGEGEGESSDINSDASHSGTSSLSESPKPWHENGVPQPWQSTSASRTSHNVQPLANGARAPLLVQAVGKARSKGMGRPETPPMQPHASSAESRRASVPPSVPLSEPQRPRVTTTPSLERFPFEEPEVTAGFVAPCVPGFSSYPPAPLPARDTLVVHTRLDQLAPPRAVHTSLDQLASFAPVGMLPTVEEIELELQRDAYAYGSFAY